jgi:hypothetical protein
VEELAADGPAPLDVDERADLEGGD